MNLWGQPVLWHVIERLRRVVSTLPLEVAITTSTNPADDELVAFGQKMGVPVFRGPEANVLERFNIALSALEGQADKKFDAVLRVTGDAPLLDPNFVGFLLRELEASDADFLILKDGVACIQEGVDLISRRAFDVLMSEAVDDPVAQEHVTAWLKAHPETIRVQQIDIEPDYQFSGARLSVDTPSDLAFLELLGKRLGIDADAPASQWIEETAPLKAVARLLRAEPGLLAINAHVRQKPENQREARVIMRADGGGALGFGHLTRSLNLAEVLRDKEGIGVSFITGVHPDADADVARRFFEVNKMPVQTMPEGMDELAYLMSEVARLDAAAIILDVRTVLSAADVEKLKQTGVQIIVLDDAADRRLNADLAFYPPVPQAEKLNWGASMCERFVGAEWLLLAPSVAKQIHATREHIKAESAQRLLITMGGSDPKQLTLPIAQACARVFANDVAIDVVVGPSVAEVPTLLAELEMFPSIMPYVAPENPGALYASADFAITSFGVTAYELAGLGVPALYVALTEDHAQSALGAEALGFGLLSALADDLQADDMARHAKELFYSDERLKMAEAGRAAVDGLGAQRVAEKIAEHIKRGH